MTALRAFACRVWSKLPAGIRAWLTDAAERIGSSFVQGLIAAVAAGALAQGLNASAARVLLVGGLTAAAATVKAILAAFISSRGASPAALGIKPRGLPGPPAEQIVTRLVTEAVVEGKRLGRHVEHDVRSLLFQVPEGAAGKVRWVRRAPIFNQGDIGSCTGNAMAGWIGTDNATRKGDPSVREKTALALYEKATTLDSIRGAYPPDDTGSSGLAVAKAAKEAGYIRSYQHATSLPALLTALQHGPVIVGTDWYEGFDTPDSKGLVHATGPVRGGHEYEVVGYDGEGLLECVNSWGRSWGHAGRFFISTADMGRLLAAQGDCTVPAA